MLGLYNTSHSAGNHHFPNYSKDADESISTFPNYSKDADESISIIQMGAHPFLCEKGSMQSRIICTALFFI
jgi:hypothetical protein